MIPRPSAVTAELAKAALNCVPLAQARKLAEWIGPSRPLTGSGVLKPAMAIEACRALDPAHFRLDKANARLSQLA